MSETIEKVRVDRWLWAARFFKTRSLAKLAVQGGKVKLGGEKVKPSKQLEKNNVLSIRLASEEYVVEVLGLSERRKGAALARTLYQETEKSMKLRKKRLSERKARSNLSPNNQKPNKKQRRQIHKFLEF